MGLWWVTNSHKRRCHFLPSSSSGLVMYAWGGDRGQGEAREEVEVVGEEQPQTQRCNFLPSSSSGLVIDTWCRAQHMQRG